MVVQEALHDDLAGHGSNRGGGQPGCEQCHPEDDPGSGTEQRLERAIGLFETAHARAAGVEGGRGGDQHGGVDRTGDDHGDNHVHDLEAEQPLLLFGLFDDHASLGQRRVQEDGVRHNRGAQDAGCQQDALRIGEVRDEGVVDDQAPFRAAEEEFHHVGDGDDGQEAGDDRLQRAEAIAFQAEDQEGDDGGQQAGDPEWQAEEQVERHGRAQELG